MKKKVLFLGFITALLLTGCGKQGDNSILPQDENVEFGGKSTVDLIGYAGETCYAGNVSLPSYLFEVPFQKTENYVTNKSLSQSVTKKDYEYYKKSFENYIDLVYGNDSRSLLKNQEQFITELDGLTEGVGEQNANAFLEWYIDNEITCKSNAKTDYCMFYKDDYYYILRASVSMEIFSEKEEITAVPNGITLKKGEKMEYLCEMQFFPGRPNVIVKVLWYDSQGNLIAKDDYSRDHELSMDETGCLIYRSRENVKPLAIDTDNGLITEPITQYENGGYKVWIYENNDTLSYATAIVGDDSSYIDENGVFQGNYEVAVTNQLNNKTKTTNCN